MVCLCCPQASPLPVLLCVPRHWFSVRLARNPAGQRQRYPPGTFSQRPEPQGGGLCRHSSTSVVHKGRGYITEGSSGPAPVSRLWLPLNKACRSGSLGGLFEQVAAIPQSTNGTTHGAASPQPLTCTQSPQWVRLVTDGAVAAISAQQVLTAARLAEGRALFALIHIWKITQWLCAQAPPCLLHPLSPPAEKEALARRAQLLSAKGV